MYLIFFFFLRFFPLFQEGMTMENDIFVLIFFILFMKILYICELIMKVFSLLRISLSEYRM